MLSKIYLSIPGITCTGCVAKIEQSIKSIKDVTKVQVNLADKTAIIDGHPDINTLLRSLTKIGKPAIVINNEQQERQQQVQKNLQEYYYLLKSGLIATFFSLPLMISMFFPLAQINSTTSQWLWGILGIFVLAIMYYSGKHFYIGFWNSLKYRTSSMDTLITIGTSTAWLFSMIIIITPNSFPAHSRHVYFEAALMIIGLINIGKALEIRAKIKTSSSIRKLLALQPEIARVIRNKKIMDVPVTSIQVNEIICVRPGGKIPIDGSIIKGSVFIDESMLTGEPTPIKKSEGDTVYAGSICKNGTIFLRTEKVASKTSLSQIIKLVDEAQTSKIPLTQITDKIIVFFIPTVICIAIFSSIIWYLFGPEPSIIHMAISFATVLIIACPCALGLAIPMSLMSGIGRAAEFGILIRNGEALQKASKLTVAVLDKTGTITKGFPEVTNLFINESVDQHKILSIAASLTSLSSHPLANAIVKKSKEQNVPFLETSDFISETGLGISGKIMGYEVFLGSETWMKKNNITLDNKLKQSKQETNQEQTSVFLAINNQVVALFAISDPIRPSSKEAIVRLKNAGLKVVMLSGDQLSVANAIAKQVGIEKVRAEMLPNQKAEFIQQLQEEGEKVCMVGDGINDAPALAQSDVSFAIGSGTNIAIETADITLAGSSLHNVIDAIRLSKATVRNIYQNLFGAFIYNGLGIPIAAGALYPFTGLLLNPIVAGAAMAFSSLTVVTNANRLRLFPIRKS